MYSTNIIKRIPGDIPPSKKESQGYIDDLGKKQKFELEELLERQMKILANKNFISKLPDKGEKIINFRDKILKELEYKKKMEEAANSLSRLNIASEGKAAMSELEWTGKYDDKNGESTTKIIELDNDDEDNPLKILAQPTGSGVHKKKIIHLASDESLIKPEDIKEIESFKTSLNNGMEHIVDMNEHMEYIVDKVEKAQETNEDESSRSYEMTKIDVQDPEDTTEIEPFKTNPLDVEHVKYIVDKVEKVQETNKKERLFRPYKTTKSNVHDPMKEKQRKLHKNWEVTAATPPLIVHEAAKILSLNESLKLQKEQSEKLQKIQAKHAVERLASQIELHGIGTAPRNIGNYRLQQHMNGSVSSSSSEDEENEVHDEEDNDRGGTVVFTIDSIES